jgi:acyl carrier protein
MLKEILVVNLRLSAADISPEVGIEEAGLDSIALVELAMVMSSRLGIEVADSELTDIETIGQIVSLMEERVVPT